MKRALGRFFQQSICQRMLVTGKCVCWQCGTLSVKRLGTDAGEQMPDAGSAYICSYSMQREMAKARQLVGYCPQFDALAGTLTGMPHFSCHA